MPILLCWDIWHDSRSSATRKSRYFNYRSKIVIFWDRDFKQKRQYLPWKVLFFVFLDLLRISNSYLAISVRRTCVNLEYRDKIVICCHSDFKQKLKYPPLTGLVFVFLYWSGISNSYLAISGFLLDYGQKAHF